MNYDGLWKILEKLMAELMGKGVTIPQELMEDLKSAKFYISIYKTNPTALDIAENIELYIENVESNLLYLAESDMGKAYADEWLRKIYSAREEESKPTTAATGFVMAIPKSEHWIRINLSDFMVEEDIQELLKMLNLSSTPQENGYLLIHGKEENVKAFVKKVGEKIERRKR